MSQKFVKHGDIHFPSGLIHLTLRCSITDKAPFVMSVQIDMTTKYRQITEDGQVTIEAFKKLPPHEETLPIDNEEQAWVFSWYWADKYIKDFEAKVTTSTKT